MAYDLLIQGGHVVDPINGVDQIADVGIKDGKIVEVAPELDSTSCHQLVSGKGLVVIPGVIDSHAHVARPNAHGAGFRMMVKAGVTTCVDFEGPIGVIAEEISTYGCGLNVASIEGVRPGFGVSKVDAPHSEVDEKVNLSLDQGGIGVKLLGGHYPLSPETTEDVIATAAKEGAYVGFHAGSTATGSTILGMEEAIALAGKNPLHIAHINAYCRGLVDDPLLELKRAMEALRNAPHIVSESHLAPFNGCSGTINKEGLPESHVTRNCLKTFGYSVDEAGLKQAILDKACGIYARVGGEMVLIWGEDACKRWQQEGTRVGTSWPVNHRTTALVCATEKRDRDTFLVDAISSDGGAIPRNFILTHGMDLVRFGALSLKELVLKISYNPAQLFGFVNKGHFTPGADADMTLFKPESGEAAMTITNGQFSMAGGVPINRPGCVLTTERGVKAMQKQNTPYEVIDLKQSWFYKREH